MAFFISIGRHVCHVLKQALLFLPAIKKYIYEKKSGNILNLLSGECCYIAGRCCPALSPQNQVIFGKILKGLDTSLEKEEQNYPAAKTKVFHRPIVAQKFATICF